MAIRKRRASAVVGWARLLCGIWLLGLGVLSGACRDSVGTALYVTIEFPPTVLMDQIRVSGTVAGNGIGPHVLPEQPDRLLANGETFRVLLPSAPDMAQAELQVEGLSQGERVAFGTGQVQVHEGMEVDVTVRLEPAPSDFCPNCPDGCCMSGICTTSTFNTCGTGGVLCKTCDRDTTDTCSSEGACTCGQGPPCDPRSANRCAGGACRCGSNPPCGAGLVCESGQCVCNASSCSGCCSSSTVCEPGTTRDRCGKGGAVCRRCSQSQTCGSDGTCA
jgi:hypothetical protein